jgi:hypothetical protein
VSRPLPRERAESPFRYVRRVLHAVGVVDERQMAQAVNVDSVPAPVPPLGVAAAVARLRRDLWVIETVDRDRAGYATYRLVSEPEQPQKIKKEMDHAERVEAGQWRCVTCHEPAKALPTQVLASLAVGRCSHCRKNKAYFNHI